jgi:SpoVK/Ycf46/Vps4 family AAA+-type ATPase
MLSAVGLLRQGQCVEADKSRLIGTHVGQTAPLVEAKIKQAMNGVLFIDEAYAIAGIKQGDTKASPGPYEQDAIDTLLKGMEDNRDRLVVIVAGYTNEMRLFLESNTGLKSRFGRWIEFKTYGRDQLLDIFNGMLKRDKYTVTPDAERQLRQEIQRLHDPRDPAFGNARVVRGFYEQVQMAQAKRIAFLPNLESQPNDVFMTFQADDIRTAAEKRQ